jgi:sortase A
MNPVSVATNHFRQSRTIIVRAAYYLLLTSGIAGLAYAGYIIVNAHNYQAREQVAFEDSRVKNASQGDGSHRVIEGGVIGEMEIPRLGLKAIIVQGDSSDILERAVGHLPETALPGEAGNIALAGHRDTFFRPLKDILPGDGITLKTPAGDFQYSVESTTVVPPTAVQVVQPSGGRILTLVTCFPFYYVGSAPNRFIVRARQIETWP